MDFTEFGNALKIYDGLKEQAKTFLHHNYVFSQRKFFPLYDGGYEIKEILHEPVQYIFRTDGEDITEEVKLAFYGPDEPDENGEWHGRAKDFVLPEGHEIDIRYFDTIAWYAKVPNEFILGTPRSDFELAKERFDENNPDGALPFPYTEEEFNAL